MLSAFAASLGRSARHGTALSLEESRGGLGGACARLAIDTPFPPRVDGVQLVADQRDCFAVVETQPTGTG